MIDCGVRCVISHCLKGWPCSAGVCRSCDLPAEVDRGLVDACLLTALSHDWVFGVMGVTGSHTDQRISWRWRLLTAFFSDLLDIVIVWQRHHLWGEPKVHMKPDFDSMTQNQDFWDLTAIILDLWIKTNINKWVQLNIIKNEWSMILK